MHVYDYVVVGSGFSGMYMCYLLEQKYPNVKILLLEKNDVFGGKLNNYERVHGKLHEDDNFLHLVNKLSIPISVHFNIIHYTKQPINILQLIKECKKIVIPRSLTFKEFFIKQFGEEMYYMFNETTGTRIYEHASAMDTVFHHRFDTEGWNFSLNTQDLIKKLLEHTPNTVKMVSTDVLKIDYENDNIYINDFFVTKNLIFANKNIQVLNQKQFHKIFEKSFQFHHLYQIKITTKKNIKCNTLICENPYEKIIEVSDNHYIIESTSGEILDKTSTDIEKYLGNEITDIESICWLNVFCTYKTLHSNFLNREEFITFLQNFKKGIYVVGDYISLKQNSIEGCIESVHKIINKL